MKFAHFPHVWNRPGMAPSDRSNVEYLLDRNLVFVGSPETVANRITAAATEGLFNSVFAEFNMVGPKKRT